MALQQLNHGMDMVWHDAPRQQAVALAIEMQEGVLDQGRDVRSTLPTLSPSRIEFAIDARGSPIGKLSASLNLTNWTVSGEST